MNWSEAERPQTIREALQRIEAEIPRLRRYARHLGHEPDHADDIVREGLVRAVAQVPTAIAKIHSGPPGASLRGWLFAILRSCHIDEIRGTRPDAPASTREASSPATRRSQEASAALPALGDAYLSLSEERREVLLLVAIEGLQHDEAATILGVPLGTVRSRLAQGRQVLRETLEAGRTALASPPPAHRLQGIGA